MRIVTVNESAKLITGGPYAWGEEQPPAGYVSEEWALTNGYRYTPPAPEPVPDEVAGWAIRAVLETRGKLKDLIDTIDGMTGGDATKVRWIFRDAPTIPRDGETVNNLGASIGYTPSQVDDLFREAERFANP